MTKALEDLTGAIDDLPSVSCDVLISRYRELYRSEPPKQISRDLLVRAISFRLQEKAYGGQSAALKRRLRSMAEELRQTGTIEAKGVPSIKPGTRLIREWQGAVHEVTVAEDGFVYRDQRYRSLSHIARDITGTRWSGPAFFGLKKTSAGKGARDGA